MRITSADLYDITLDTAAYWNIVLLRLNTDAGIYGLGETALAYGIGSAAGLGMLEQMVARHVVGEDPMRIERMWQRLCRQTFWGQGGGPVVYGAMSAIDECLWDIKGKALDCPVYELLGGKMRDSVRVYANGWYAWKSPEQPRPCNTPQEYHDAALRCLELGFDALKFDPFEKHSGPGWHYPGQNPPRTLMDLAYARVEAVREAVGPGVEIGIEIHGALGPAAAIEMGCRYAPLSPMFYEEPVDTMNAAVLKRVSENVPIPIAAGERLYTRYGFREFIEAQAIDVLQPDLGLAGGITEVAKIASYADTYDLHVQPHLCAGPIAAAATLQLDAAIPNFFQQEWFVHHIGPLYDLVEQAYDPAIVGGHRPIPDEPGLGVTLNEERVAPFLRAHIE